MLGNPKSQGDDEGEGLPSRNVSNFQDQNRKKSRSMRNLSRRPPNTDLTMPYDNN